MSPTPACEWGADTEEPCQAGADFVVWRVGCPKHFVCASHLEPLAFVFGPRDADKIRFEPIDPHHRRRSVIDLGRRA